MSHSQGQVFDYPGIEQVVSANAETKNEDHEKIVDKVATRNIYLSGGEMMQEPRSRAYYPVSLAG